MQTETEALLARVGQYEAVLNVALIALDEIRKESGKHQERLVLARITLGSIETMSQQVLDCARRVGVAATTPAA